MLDREIGQAPPLPVRSVNLASCHPAVIAWIHKHCRPLDPDVFNELGRCFGFALFVRDVGLLQGVFGLPFDPW